MIDLLSAGPYERRRSAGEAEHRTVPDGWGT
jgi:hypothetical protein